jgi:anti-anti-sigma factor
MKLSLVRIDKGGFVAVAAEGTITTADIQGSAAKGANIFENVLGPAWANNQVLLDMSQVTFIDSSAIGWLIASNKEFKKAGGRFVPHSIQPSVRQVLDLLRIGQAVTLAKDEEAAKALLAETK